MSIVYLVVNLTGNNMEYPVEEEKEIVLNVLEVTKSEVNAKIEDFSKGLSCQDEVVVKYIEDLKRDRQYIDNAIKIVNNWYKIYIFNVITDHICKEFG